MLAVIYARYSSYNQTERSIEGQLEDCMQYAERMGYKVVGSYIDRAKSGTDAEHRTDFQRMIKDSAHKGFDTVLVWKFDRFARNRYDSAVYKAKLKKNGVRLVSINEQISDDPSGILMESIFEGMAEHYSANLSQNVKRGNRVALEKGSGLGGHAPYGYRFVDKKPVIDETEAKNVRFIFESFRDGMTAQKIADALNEKGFRTHDGRPFYKYSFQKILRNRKYIGDYVVNGISYSGIYPRIIEDNLFSAVQKRIASNRHAPAAAKSKTDYLLQGKLFCGICGSPMIGESGKSHTGVVHHYYTCAKRKKDHACKKHNERKCPLEYYIVEQTMINVLTNDKIDYIAKALDKKYKEEYSNSSVEKYEKIIAKLDKEIEDSVDSFIAAKGNTLLQNKISERIETLSAQKDDATVDLSAAKIALAHRPSIDEIKKFLKSFSGGNPLDETYQKRIIDTFINAVFVFDDKLAIYYNVYDSDQITFSEMQSDIDSESNGSDLNDLALPNQNKSEPFLLKDNVFGYIKKREH